MWLRRMFKNKRAQSMAEYGILFAAIIAIAAGALSIALKGGIQQKERDAMTLLLGAGNTELEAEIGALGAIPEVDMLSEDVRQSTTLAAGYQDRTVMLQGGATQSINEATTSTTAVSTVAIGQAAP
ncbi:hypothetical protein ACFL38_01980 [Candidatus Omnitrophota bacterium]